MKFRAKIFLAVLLPATLLVAVAVIVAIVDIRSRAYRAAQQEFDRTRKAVEVIFNERQNDLRLLEPVFHSAWFDEFIMNAEKPEGRDSLRKNLAYQLENLHLKLDYFAVAGPDGKVWLRINEVHQCAPDCKHDGEGDWVALRTQAVFSAGGDPYMGRGVRYFQPEDKRLDAVIVARNLRKDLERICQNLRVEMALQSTEGAEIWRSLAAWDPKRDGIGDIQIAGQHYFSGRAEQEGMLVSLLLLRDMGDLDRDMRSAAGMGLAGVAIASLLAALVSVRVARGVSTPVEALVGAVKKVALGEFETKVEVVGKDEIGALGMAFNEMTVGLRKRQEIMEKTLSRDVAEEFLKGGTERGGERRVITIIFMDIRGYTSGTEGMDPADVVVMLNELMDLLAGAIERHGGLVNKFLGDGLMAMFGAPKPLENHPLKAVQAGIEMQKQMERWNHRRTARGLPSFYSGIGINTGEVVCGKVGGRSRLEYTLIGEEVNLTSRICGKAAPRQVLITKQTWLKVKEQIKVRELEAVSVKGLSYPIQIYEVLG